MADGANDDDIERLKRLQQDLGASRGTAGPAPATSDPAADEAMRRARSAGFRALGEFSAAIVAGLLIGYIVDRAAGTLPAFLIVGLLLGTAAGFLNIYRAARPGGR